MKFGLFEIPEGVARIIFSFLGEKELVMTSKVSRDYKRLASENIYWESLFKKRFEALLGFNSFLASFKSGNNNYKNIFDKLRYLKHSSRSIRSVWQLAVLTGNLEFIKNVFEGDKENNLLTDKIYQRFFKNSPLHYAASLGNNDVLNYFLEKGLSIDILNTKEETPLHAAAMYGQLPTMLFLVQRSASPILITEDGKNLAHCCALGGNLDAFKYAVSLPTIDATLLTKDRQSVLHLAAMSSNGGLIFYIVQNIKVDPHLRDLKGNQAVDYITNVEVKGQFLKLLPATLSEPHTPKQDSKKPPPGCSIS